MILYWIRLESHSDIAVDGYVGVTFNFDQRMNEHLKFTSKLDSHFGNAISKYGWDNMIKEVIFEGSSEDCYAKEKELRPKFQIGWNEAIGGLGGDRSVFIDYKRRKNQGWTYERNGEKNPFYGKEHSHESIKKMSKSKCKNIITTPDGIFYGFREVARFYKINKITAQKWASKKKDWSYENK